MGKGKKQKGKANLERKAKRDEGKNFDWSNSIDKVFFQQKVLALASCKKCRGTGRLGYNNKTNSIIYCKCIAIEHNVEKKEEVKEPVVVDAIV